MLTRSQRRPLSDRLAAAVSLLFISGLLALSDDQLQGLGLRSGPPLPMRFCADSSNYCREWAMRSECDRNPSYMMRACPLSCGRCRPMSRSLVDEEDHELRLHTDYGTMTVKLYRNVAPVTTKKILAGAQLGPDGCQACYFYRAESNPLAARSLSGGGFLIGHVGAISDTPPIEGNLQLRRGHVAFIPNTREILVALRSHPEFGMSHTVFGELDTASLAVALVIAQLPVKEVRHPIYGVPNLLLVEPVAFSLDWYRPGGPTTEDKREGERLVRKLTRRLGLPLSEVEQLVGSMGFLSRLGVNVSEMLQQQGVEARQQRPRRAEEAARNATLKAAGGAGANVGRNGGAGGNVTGAARERPPAGPRPLKEETAAQPHRAPAFGSGGAPSPPARQDRPAPEDGTSPPTAEASAARSEVGSAAGGKAPPAGKG